MANPATWLEQDMEMEAAEAVARPASSFCECEDRSCRQQLSYSERTLALYESFPAGDVVMVSTSCLPPMLGMDPIHEDTDEGIVIYEAPAYS